MKSIIDCISESLILIFEKKSWNKLSEKLANKIIAKFKNDDTVDMPKEFDREIPDDAKTVAIEGLQYGDIKATLYVSYSENYKMDEFVNDSLKDKLKNIAIILIHGTVEHIDETDDTLAHEIRHFYDALTGKGGNENNTYDEDDLMRFEKFLYLISPTEQNAHTAGFRKWIQKEKNLELLLSQYKKIYPKDYKKLRPQDIDGFIEKFCTELTNKRHALLKDKETDDENQLKDITIDIEINGEKVSKTADELLENPVRLFEYNYYLLNSKDNFVKFITTNLASEKSRPNDDIEHIKSKLSVFNNGQFDEDVVYKVILTKYKQTFNTFKKILENALHDALRGKH